MAVVSVTASDSEAVSLLVGRKGLLCSFVARNDTFCDILVVRPEAESVAMFYVVGPVYGIIISELSA